jgi:tRNA G46 methylase TrmB
MVTLVEMAQANPALNYVGIEVYEAGIGRLINSAHIKQLNNFLVVCCGFLQPKYPNLFDLPYKR